MSHSTKAIPIIFFTLLFALGACSNDNEIDNDTDETLVTAPTVEVNFSFGQKTFGDYDYEFVDATMRGTIQRDDGSTGEYAVPIKLAYPVGGGNNVAVVDMVNTALWAFSSQMAAGNPHACVRGEDILFCDDEEGDTEGRRVEELFYQQALNTTQGFLMREGYAYLAVQWDKGVLDNLGSEPPEGYQRHRLAYGTIENPLDVLEILQEAARWLRDPSNFEGDAAPDADLFGSDHVIGFGYSQTASMIYPLIHEGINESEDGPLYDGFVGGVGTGMCRFLIEDPPFVEPGLPCFATDVEPWETGDTRVIVVDAQTDLELYFGAMARDPTEGDPEVDANPNYRRWEVAGTPHLPAGILDVGQYGAEGPQLHADFRPVVRAAFYHMEQWIKDNVDPPPSVHIEGAVEDDPDSETFGLLATEVDEDGNAVGGIRLPHLPRELGDGTVVGAPVGTYLGTAWEYMEEEPPNIAAAIGGAFERFSAEELAERYPTREDYLERYEAALDEVIAEGYVLEEDRSILLAHAGEVDIPEAPEAADLPDAAEACIGHACPGESGIDLPEGGVVRLELVRPHDWGPEVRTSAWFAGDQAPDARPFTRPPENWHIQDGDDLCRDLREDDFFPGGDVETRAYLDAGEAVQFVTEGTDIRLPRVEDGQDDATWQWHDILYRDHVPAADVVAGADYDVVLAGGEGLPATTYEGALRLPGDFQLAFPNTDDVVIMLAGRDFRFLAGDHPEPHEFDYTFVRFADKFGPVGLCIGPPSQHITVPADFLEVMPPGGVVQVGFLNHQVAERDGRRIDFIGVNSREARYLVDDEYLPGTVSEEHPQDP